MQHNTSQFIFQRKMSYLTWNLKPRHVFWEHALPTKLPRQLSRLGVKLPVQNQGNASQPDKQVKSNPAWNMCTSIGVAGTPVDIVCHKLLFELQLIHQVRYRKHTYLSRRWSTMMYHYIFEMVLTHNNRVRPWKDYKWKHKQHKVTSNCEIGIRIVRSPDFRGCNVHKQDV